ncbi:MAG TPA: HAMP domain-containing sensor histidine kinase [Oligoflexus sp.]|uniref:sensor histidine kinase n=1 Tax=Oligoflexus sp. TaxID=1971216 RepID=UPI002D7E3F04|nr:HAMP domain-containing sensor histidine kinase [Oligoflexus sp.]HET9240674.1 HAMP domain-containing sensor histidine kinase [Oligoflexus sp.]
MSIRNTVILITLGFVLLAGITAVVLKKWTTDMEQLADAASQQMESVLASEELQISLLKFSRETLLNLARREKTPVAFRLEQEAHLTQGLSKVRNYVDTDQEKDLVDKIEASVRDYISFQHQRSRLSPEEAAQLTSSTIIDDALVSAQALTDLNKRQAGDFESRLRKVSRDADKVAAVMFGISLFGFFLAWMIVRTWIYNPVVLLRKQIDQTSGAVFKEVDERGPEEIRAIAAAFNRLGARVMTQREASLRFLAAVAHDLRNPLSAIRMSSEILPDEESPEEREAVVQIISRQAQHLDRMVGDLLDTTRIESGQLEIMKTEADLSTLVHESVALHRSTSQVHKINVSLPSGPVVAEIDPLRVMQVLNNLINNAIKYSPNGGVVSVCLLNQNGLATIEVGDNGIGIAPDDKEKIFEPFRRTATTKLTIPGVGLGLSVTRRIVESHSGTIEVESTPGKGSIFRVRLPLGAVRI